MKKRRNKARKHRGLQAVTLCISTAMVLVLLGMVVFTVLTSRNLSSYMKENLTVTMMLEQDMTDPEARKLCKKLQARPYINHLQYISKEQALKEGIRELGADPSEFVGSNPFLSSVELTLKADYANNDSLLWIGKELKAYPKVTELNYQKELIDTVNRNLAKISLALLVLALLLTFVSFSLINNTVKLSIYARRFSIHTMKLVGASWSFIRRPFVRQALGLGLLASLLACSVLGGFIYALYVYEPEVLNVLTWEVLAITAGAVFFFGIAITGICANISVNKFLRMKAGELYKI
ncbi:MAG: permease-like cell division protein FtsX [Prevotella sp.]|nr:permease-like cell division protein FtsX [Prevotella sp.]